MLQSWTARLEELGGSVCQGEVRSADLIFHLLIHSLTHLTLALSRVLGHKTPQSILLKSLRGTRDLLVMVFKACLVECSSPSGVRTSPVLVVPSRLISPVHILPFLPGPVLGPLFQEALLHPPGWASLPPT